MKAKKSEFVVREERRLKRFDLKNAFSSIMESFNLERGLWYTLVSLIKSPGSSTRHYLQDGRLRYVSPFRLLVVSTTLLVLIFNSSGFSDGFTFGFENGALENTETISEAQFKTGLKLGAGIEGDLNPEKQAKVNEKAEAVGAFFTNYFNLIIWLYIPIVAFFTWLFNRKQELNYAEHLIFNTFYTSVINLLTLVFFFGSLIDMGIVYGFYLVLSVGYFVYYYRDLFHKSWLRSIIESLSLTLISFVIYTFCIALLMAFV